MARFPTRLREAALQGLVSRICSASLHNRSEVLMVQVQRRNILVVCRMVIAAVLMSGMVPSLARAAEPGCRPDVANLPATVKRASLKADIGAALPPLPNC